MPQFDLIVLGGGSAGFAAARRARKLGATVALVERDILGGECPNTACAPAKALLRSAQALVEARRTGEYGIEVGDPRADWAAIRGRMYRIIGRAEGDAPTEARLRSQGIAVFRGEGVFLAGDTVRVEQEKLTAPRVILTTGSADVVPPIEGLRETGFLTHKEALDLHALPGSLSVIGAGPVGVEFAQIFAPLGVRVTLLSATPLPLPGEDHDISRLLLSSRPYVLARPGEVPARELSRCLQRLMAYYLEYLRKEGIRVEIGVRVERAERRNGERLLTFTDGTRTRQTSSDAIFVATGHKPVAEGIALERVGVEVGRFGVVTDERLRTTAESVWAAGDVTGIALFTHVASYQGKLAAHNALGIAPREADYRVIPRAIFCRPEVASVGLTEEQCLAKGLKYRAASAPMASIEKSTVEGEQAGLAKLLVEADTGQILGAHVIGSRAGELIQEVAVLMQDRVPARGIACTIHAFPTFSEIWEAVALELE